MIFRNVMKHVLTHYREILRDQGRGESRRVRRNFATERTREGEVDVAQRYLALVRVPVLKQSNVCVCKVNANRYQPRRHALSHAANGTLDPAPPTLLD